MPCNCQRRSEPPSSAAARSPYRGRSVAQDTVQEQFAARSTDHPTVHSKQAKSPWGLPSVRQCEEQHKEKKATEERGRSPPSPHQPRAEAVVISIGVCFGFTGEHCRAARPSIQVRGCEGEAVSYSAMQPHEHRNICSSLLQWLQHSMAGQTSRQRELINGHT